MSVSSGIITWLKGCPQIETLDMHQTENAGLYKQPAITREKLVDGTEIRTENYYVLFKKAAQLETERVNNETVLEAVETWIEAQELNGNYPTIGYDVFSVGCDNAYYMLSRDNEEAIYQATITIKYMR